MYIISEVNLLFQDDEFLGELPVKIHFSDERALDGGGVCRDMFSADWEEALKKFFDGQNVMIPVIHPDTDMSFLPLLGKIHFPWICDPWYLSSKSSISSACTYSSWTRHINPQQWADRNVC